MTKYQKIKSLGVLGVVGDPISGRTCQTTKNKIWKKKNLGGGAKFVGPRHPIWGNMSNYEK